MFENRNSISRVIYSSGYCILGLCELHVLVVISEQRTFHYMYIHLHTYILNISTYIHTCMHMYITHFSRYYVSYSL